MTAPAAAAQLRARGFALCKPDPREKKPTYRGWPTRSLEAGDFRDGDMLGIMAGPLSDGGKPEHALVIIDLDTAEAVARADEYLPATGMSEGRAGKPRSHRYYLVPFDSIPEWAHSHAEQGSAAAREKCGHPGPFIKPFAHRETRKEVVRFLGTGGQCVCPPSVHDSGERREWTGGEPGEPAVVSFLDLWDRVCQLASVCGAEIPNVVPRRFPPVRAATPVLERARKYLAKMPESISGQGGHNALFAAARAMVWGFDLPTDQALDLLANGFNARCVEPWNDRDLQHKVQDADRTPFNKPRGWLRDAEKPNRTSNSAPSSNGKPSNNGKPAAEPDAPDYPPPGPGELWDDPHRLARLFVADKNTSDGERTILQWRDGFHVWNGAAWREVADSDLDAQLAAHCRRVFEADYPHRVAGAEARAAAKGSEKVEPTTIFKVTSAVRGNAKANLAGLVNQPDNGQDAPFWRDCDPAGLPDPAEVIAAPNGLFTLPDIARDEAAPFHPPTPRFFTPNALAFNVEPDPPSPQVWLKCLNEWFSNDPASKLGLQEAFGYLLSAETRAHKILMLVGPKRSGKGTVIRVLNELVGAVNVASTSFTALSENFGLEDLIGKRVAVIPDARLSGRADIAAVVERLLSISGEDPQTVNRKNRRRITTMLKARFLLATNEIPQLPDSSGALASRFHILSMPNSFYGNEDKRLMDKLHGELPGILQWAARGFVRFKGKDYTFTANDAAARYQRELEDLSSPVRAFVRERCRIGPTEEVRTAELCRQWHAWNEERNREATDDNIFGRDLTAAFPHIQRSQPRINGAKVRVYKGIGLKDRIDYGDEGE